MKKILTHSPVSLLALLIGTGSASFGAITYIDAVEGSSGNTFATGGNLATTDWVGPDSLTANETEWNKRTIAYTDSDTIFQARHTEDTIPELTTQITGLSDDTYDVWVFFWGRSDTETETWNIDAGLTSGSLTTYGNNAFETTGVTLASTLSFDVAPDSTSNPGSTGEAMYGINIGQVTVSGSSDIDVFIDHTQTGATNRGWYDGVGYEAVPEPATFALIAGFGCLGLALFRRRT